MPLAFSSLPLLPRPFDERWCASIRAAGFQGLELWCAASQLNLREPSSAESLGRSLRSEGLVPASVHLPFYRDVETWRAGETLSVVDADRERRELALCEAELGVEAAELVGAEHVVLHLGRPDDADSPERRELVEQAIARISGHASARGINVAIENLGSALTRIANLGEAIEHVGRSMVGICVDVGNAYRNGDGAASFAAAGRELYHVHFGDLGGDGDAHRVPGQGSVPWDEVFAALRVTRYDGWRVVETADPSKGREPADAMLRALLDALRPFVARAT